MSTGPLARYAFLPYLRQGLATHITQVDDLGKATASHKERATVRVEARINGQGHAELRKDLWLVGPGDITGLHASNIVRVEPRDGATRCEPNYLAFIEFQEPDLLWRYTPAKPTANHRLRPWLALLVLQDDEFTRERGLSGPLPVIQLHPAKLASALPDPEELWAWAHVHVTGELDPEGTRDVAAAMARLQTLLETSPERAWSRLLSPRRLEEDAQYTAFLVPSFETGRRSGLGESPADVPALLPAWGPRNPAFPGGPTRMPVYHAWTFRTGKAGDFEALAEALKPMKWRGSTSRPLDVTAPGQGLRFEARWGGNGTAPLGSALRAPLEEDGKPLAWPGGPELAAQLADALNVAEALKTPGAVTRYGHEVFGYPLASPTEKDPVIAPPLYGRWHARAARLDKAQLQPGRAMDWVHELNLEPGLRVAAGLGAEAVRRNQEMYMDLAWEQLGEVEAANRALRQAQLGKEASAALFRKHLQRKPAEQLLAMSGRFLSRVRQGDKTLAQLVQSSALDAATASPAFRRLMRPQGPLLRRLPAAAGSVSAQGRLVSKLAAGQLRAAPVRTVSALQRHVSVRRLSALASYVTTRDLSNLKFTVSPVPARPLAALPQAPVIAHLPGLNVSTPQPVVRPLGFTSTPVLKPAPVVLNPVLKLTPAVVTPVLKPAPVVLNPVLKLEPIVVKPGPVVINPVPAAPSPSQAFQQLVAPYARYFSVAPQRAEPAPLPVSALGSTLAKQLNPYRAIPERWGRLLPGVADTTGSGRLDLVMACPDLPLPMYEPLLTLSPEHLIPGLSGVPDNTATLLEVNPKFIEAYLAGANHEMMRELLWREYPTDQRGTVFRWFWDAADARAEGASAAQPDITPLHTWNGTPLGRHQARPTVGGGAILVLVLRGELLRRHPRTVISAIEASWQTATVKVNGQTQQVPDLTRPRVLGTAERFPLFSAQVAPDVLLVGFALTEAMALGNPATPSAPGSAGWFFTFRERPGEPRFGLDEASAPISTQPPSWAELSWGHLALAQGHIDVDSPASRTRPPAETVAWGQDAAAMAHILFQPPSLVALHARAMISTERA
ncbi:hypothetical protein P2318_17905 [Myxococcaceae bacterium GXIMD 01537]